jgi:CheY-like chemotaxis protein
MPNLKARLLIVDDEPVITTALSHVFRGLGHSVRTAEDGFSALQEIRTEVPDILLSDLNMPGMSGFELLSVIRRRMPEVFVIASSGAFSGAEVPNGIAADAFHEKATGLQRLFELVTTATHQGRVRSGSAESTPIWISPTKDENSTVERLLIACPECLRACSLSAASSYYVVQQTDCSYCHATICYAIVEPMNPAVSRPFHRRRTGRRASISDEVMA